MVETLSDDILRQFKEAFALLDEDGDGSIPIKDLGKVMKALGQTPLPEDLPTLITEIDPQGVGSFEFPQFLNFMAERIKDTYDKDKLRFAFEVFDHEETGFNLASELRYYLTHMGNKLTEEEADEMMRQVYINDDSEIHYEDYVELLTEYERDENTLIRFFNH